MKSVPENIEIAERAGYEIFNIYTLPEKAWIEDYYEILASRAKSLINHEACGEVVAARAARELHVGRNISIAARATPNTSGSSRVQVG